MDGLYKPAQSRRYKPIVGGTDPRSGRFPVMERVSVMATAASIAVAVAAVSCTKEPQVVYETRPGWWSMLKTSDGQPLPAEVVTEDGTIIKYIRPGEQKGFNATSLTDTIGGEQIKLREEAQDGSVTLRALLPRHTLAHLMTALQREEYRLVWDQLLAAPTKSWYVDAGGFTHFQEWMIENRSEVGATLRRMLEGSARAETAWEKVGDDLTICRLRPWVAGAFRYRVIEIQREAGGMHRLLMIR